MHTKVISNKDGESGDVRIHHNGDWSGEAILQWTEDTGRIRDARIPGWAAQAIAVFHDGDSELVDDLRELLDRYCTLSKSR